MSDRHFHNYYSEYRDDEQVVDSSASFLLRRGLLERYEAFTESLNRFIKRQGVKRFKHTLLDKRIPKTYRAAAKAPVDKNKIVFLEVRYPYITNSFEVIFDELVNNYDFNIHTHFLLSDNTTRADYTKRVLNAVEDIATAKYVFLNDASDALSAIPLRKETKIIQLWHACGAFKGFGFSTADLIFGESRKEKLRHPYYGNYYLATVSSPEVIWAYEEAMNIPDESGIIQPTGVSRTDIFFKDEYKSSAFEHLYNVIPQAKNKKVILYAPTYRGRAAKARTPKRLDVEMFFKELKDDYVLLFKHHPLVSKSRRPVFDDMYRNFAFDVTDDLSIEDLIITADICISDYSSLVFEYSLYEKPMIFYAFDLDTYTDWRGFYYDYDELTPGPIFKTNYEIIDYIKNIEERFDAQEVRDFRYKFMRSCDGKSTQRILEKTIDDLEKHKKECKKFEHFYDVPKIESSLMPYHRMLKNISDEKTYAQRIYDEAVKNPVEKGSIIAFGIQSRETYMVLSKLKSKRFSFVKLGEELDEVIEKIARANYILIDQINPLLDSIKIREETRVVFLVPNAFPLNSFGKVSKEYRSGLKREQYEIAPLFSSVNAFVCPTEECAALYKPAFSEGSVPLVAGNIKNDFLFSNTKKKALLERLYDKCPNISDKKIIAFIQDDYSKEGDDSRIYEYLSRDYTFLKLYRQYNPRLYEEEFLQQNYLKDSIIDVSLIFDEYELMTIADIVVGGLKSSVYSCISTGKPVIIYSNDAAAEIMRTESFVDIEESSPTPVCSDINRVIEIIRDIENYDFERYNALKEKYLKTCDGKSAQRLMNILK